MRVVEKVLCCQEVKVFIGRGALERASEEVPENAKILLVRQSILEATPIRRVFRGIVGEVELKGGEEAKDLSVALSIVEEIYRHGLRRSDYVVSFGGGTLTDVVGFAASIYLRGLNLINIPTTLLSMVDAAIGGKNAVNFKGVKNVLGTFYQPKIIVADSRFLDTLPQGEYINGLAEVVKYAFALDPELYGYLKSNSREVLSRDSDAVEFIIERSILDKLSVVEQDVHDVRGVRVVLNFGHTVGHLIESITGFSVPHGKAVAVGMVYETAIAVEMGLADKTLQRDLVSILRLYGLPTNLRELGVEMPRDHSVLESIISRDKKSGLRGITIPIIVDIGKWMPLTVDIDSYVGALLDVMDRRID